MCAYENFPRFTHAKCAFDGKNPVYNVHSARKAFDAQISTNRYVEIHGQSGIGITVQSNLVITYPVYNVGTLEYDVLVLRHQRVIEMGIEEWTRLKRTLGYKVRF